jgi:phosphinothricin acetyltransferase
VLEDAGRTVGFAYATHHRARAAYRWAADVAIYVDASYQRRGAGRRLYGALLELLRRQGLRSACAGITLPNEASVGLHEALGFERVGIYRAIGWKAGAWRDVGWWQLQLAAGDGGPPAEPGPPQRLSES